MNQKSNKCSYDECNKKLKLTDLKCRCEHVFCSIHRLPEKHNCKHNYKINSFENKKMIESMKCVSDKLIKI